MPRENVTAYVVRIHKVNFTQREEKHTIAFARRAMEATIEPLRGWANPGNSKAIIAPTIAEAIEKLRVKLGEDIKLWDSQADLSDFTFNIGVSEVEEGAFYTHFMVYGSEFYIHRTN